MLIIATILAAIAFAQAELVPVPFSNKNIQVYMASEPSTVSQLSTIPVLINGKPTCAYMGSYQTNPDRDGECPDMNLYHLAKVASDDRSLTCFYDITQLTKRYVITVANQQECPDAIFAEAGFSFRIAVYYDRVDQQSFYYFHDEDLPKQSFDISEQDLYRFHRLKQQIDYRQKFYKSAPRKALYEF